MFFKLIPFLAFASLAVVQSLPCKPKPAPTVPKCNGGPTGSAESNDWERLIEVIENALNSQLREGASSALETLTDDISISSTSNNGGVRTTSVLVGSSIENLSTITSELLEEAKQAGRLELENAREKLARAGRDALAAFQQLNDRTEVAVDEARLNLEVVIETSDAALNIASAELDAAVQQIEQAAAADLTALKLSTLAQLDKLNSESRKILEDAKVALLTSNGNGVEIINSVRIALEVVRVQVREVLVNTNDSLTEKVNEIVDDIKNVLDNAVRDVENIVDSVVVGVRQIAASLNVKVKDVTNILDVILKNFVDQVNNVAKEVVTALNNIIQNVGGGLVKAVSDVRGVIGVALDAIANVIKEILDAIINVIEDIAGTIISILTK